MKSHGNDECNLQKKDDISDLFCHQFSEYLEQNLSPQSAEKLIYIQSSYTYRAGINDCFVWVLKENIVLCAM